jgi:hypothetical protein
MMTPKFAVTTVYETMNPQTVILSGWQAFFFLMQNVTRGENANPMSIQRVHTDYGFISGGQKVGYSKKFGFSFYD